MSNGSDELVMKKAKKLHSETLVMDAHLCSLFDLVGDIKPFQEGTESSHADLPKLRKAGIGAVVMSAFLGERIFPYRGVKAGLEYIESFYELGKIPAVKICTSMHHLMAAHQEGALGVFLSLEGGEFLEGSISALRMYYRLGLRFLGLTWNERNWLADGAAYSMSRGGLSPFGLEVIKEATRLGVVIDAAHISEAGFWDLYDQCEAPFIVSHANCHALYNHPRNLTDDQLVALRDIGGVVGISFNPTYMADDRKHVSISTVVQHIRHALDVAGEEYVALGTDYDSYGGFGPIGLEDVSNLHSLTVELLKAGIAENTITGILGGNLRRVMRAVLA
jgi:membrane dipeptidase